MLEGGILKSLIIISVPIIFANILQTCYQLIDTFWVGRLGAEAVAAVSLSFPVLFFLTSIGMGLSIAGSVLVAQYNGKGDKRNVSLSVGQTFSIVFLVSIVLSALGYLLSERIMSWLTSDPAVLGDSITYLRISLIAMPAVFIFSMVQSTLRGVGEVKLPMLVILGTVILNFFLDPIFMFGWRFVPPMGVTGVAIATIITEVLSAIIGVWFLTGGKHGVKLYVKDLKIRQSWAKRLFKLGIPSSIEFSLRSFGMLAMMTIVSLLGTLAVASYGIGIRLLSIVIIPAIGLSISSSTLVGNNLGAGQKERAQKISATAMWLGFLALSIIGALMFVFSEQLSSFFIPGDAEVISRATSFIKIMSVAFGFIGIQMVAFGTLRAAGMTKRVMFLATFSAIMAAVLCYVLAITLGFGEFGVWISYPIINVTMASIALFYYLKRDWLQKKII